ncbi:hypothetical protein V6N11_075966 [Hibiscus sabdariffa]|uniref:RING-type E3 ubiquitin transferase n=1 Tax=Hibiscus sabdariffa TaxID=183260 RepID=A0ABR2Q4V8_9ROSI
MQSQDQGSNSREAPTLRPFLENIEMNANDGHGSGNHGTVVQSILRGQGQRTGSGPRQLDLNEPLQLSLDLSRTERSLGNQQIQAAGGSSWSIMTHSGRAGHVGEETINRQVLPTNGQSGLLCKRRTPEMPQPQNNVLSIPTAANSSNNGTRVARPQLPVAAPPIQIGQTDNFQRNTRLRTIGSQRNPGPASVSTWNPSNFNVQQATGHHHQRRPGFPPLVSFSMQNSQQMSAPANPAMLHRHQQRPIVAVPNPLRAPLSSLYRNGPTMSARGRPSFGSPASMIQSANMQPNMNLVNRNRSFLRNIGASSEIQSSMIQSVNMQPNMNLVNGNPSFLRNVGASSDIQSGRGMYNSSFSSLGYRQPSMGEQTAQRMQYFLESSEARRMAHNYPIESNGYTDLGELEVQLVNSAIAAVRLGGNRFLLSRTTVSQVAEQRRRLIFQLRNYLRLVRRTGGLRMEDAREMGRVFLQGMYALENGHDDMPLYFDNMSFEGLLDVGEPIGSSGTGLRVATIRANLRRRRFLPITAQPTAEAEKCCICQDYANGEELGKLDCGHDFHFNCIKRWLRRKNLCPICKKIALAV